MIYLDWIKTLMNSLLYHKIKIRSQATFAVLFATLLVSGCLGNDISPERTEAASVRQSSFQDTNPEMIGGDSMSTGCSDEMDPDLFADPAKLRELVRSVAGFGLRSTASEPHNNTIDWIEANLRRMPNLVVQSDSYDIDRWEPTPRATGAPGRDLIAAGSLRVVDEQGRTREVPVAGAVPYSLPTSKTDSFNDLVYLPAGTAITPANSKDKVIVREVGTSALPYAAFLALSYYISPDLLPRMVGQYDRPYLFTDAPMAQEIVDAGVAGAKGMVLVFNLPKEQIAGYFDPHRGTHFVLPAVFVGAEEGELLKSLAMENGKASLAIAAERDMAPTRNLIATLAGQSEEKIVVTTNTDGNTWVQENGNAGLLALIDYLSRRPLECRPKTIEFVFGTAHLHISKEGTFRYAKQLNKDYDEGKVAFAMVVEHLGTKEILPEPRSDGGPGMELKFTGKMEPAAWFASESPALFGATVNAVKKHNLPQTAVLRGQDIPMTARLPVHCSFGGIGTGFQGELIPTIATISGPWSLWAPSFGESALDFNHMHKQLLAVGDILLNLQALSREVIAGPIPLFRQLRDNGLPTCEFEFPPEQAPGQAD
ncbi:MAG: hypothetical protein V7542_12935 [Limnobacter sp.]